MIAFGIDILLQDSPPWKRAHIAFVTNDAATTQKGISSRKALLDNGFNIIKLFSPEHGLHASGADGAFIQDGIDELTQLPIISLYGAKLQPSKEDLKGIDIILFDIPDSGVRFYTYLWTMTYVLEAAAAHGIPMVILDRPNPIGEDLHMAEGPMLDITCASFIGRWNIPITHSCTFGELANYFNATRNIKATLSTYACSAHDRKMQQPAWGLPFIPTSPAIQCFEAMQIYPGLCFLEATNLHEGRGTEFSFQSVAAPWLETDILKGLLQNMFEEELTIETIHFVSGSSTYENELCNGLRFMVNDSASFKPVYFGFVLIKLIKDIHPNFFKWDTYKTNVNPTGNGHLDKLIGIENAGELFDLSFPLFLAKITKAISVTPWKEDISKYLLY